MVAVFGLLISVFRCRAIRVCIAVGDVLADSQLQWFQFYLSLYMQHVSTWYDSLCSFRCAKYLCAQV